MKHLKDKILIEQVIKKSRFITILTPVTSEDEIPGCLDSIKKEFPKATHYCTAYIIGKTGQYQGSNDDGEPSGTAGIPMLEVLNKNNVSSVYAVIVRYYGGIKLGASGLIRAYSGGISEALKHASFYRWQKMHHIKITFPYDMTGELDYLFKDETILNKDYLKDVTYELYLKDLDEVNKLKHRLIKFENLGFKDVKVDI